MKSQYDFFDKIESSKEEDFLPVNDVARIAVERARKIVRENNEMIVKLKSDSNIEIDHFDHFLKAAQFSHDDAHSVDLYKIKSTIGFTDFFKDIFGVF